MKTIPIWRFRENTKMNKNIYYHGSNFKEIILENKLIEQITSSLQISSKFQISVYLYYNFVILKTIFLKVDLMDLNKTQICRILPYFFSAVIIVIEIVSLHFRQYVTIN